MESGISQRALPNQYHLIGEYVPIWLLIGLLMIGVAGSVITAMLLMTPEITKEMLKSWVSQPISKERFLVQPSPVVDTAEMPMAGTPQIPAAELIEPIPEELQVKSPSSQKDPKENPEVSPTSSTDQSDRPMTTASPDASVEQEASVMDETPNIEELKDTHDSLSPSPDIATAPAPQARIETATDQLRDCPPIFTVTFNHSSVQPIELDLNVKVTRLREWLDLHPKTTILIEGFTDSSGPEELNLLISHRRAKVVSKLLARAGIANNQIVTRAFGEYAPLAGLPTESEKNRRVSIRIEGAHTCPEAQEDGEQR